MGGDTSINSIKYKDLKKWMSKNHWELVKKNGNNHEIWEYNLEENGKYLRSVLSQSGSHNIINPESVNSHVEGGTMREYTVKSIYEYMGLNRAEFLDSFRNGKQYSQKTLISKFKNSRDIYNAKHKNF